ncbi:NPP1 family protein [Aureivirga sp. CE67]|uniref:NPP1 family protein n=1 Tax=Aureivirga sp. CE67 TaxID=1788983 RepID=UPI0018CB9BBF|nr:NPP1 family protein [Aureivirga sp. CE67]
MKSKKLILCLILLGIIIFSCSDDETTDGVNTLGETAGTAACSDCPNYIPEDIDPETRQILALRYAPQLRFDQVASTYPVKGSQIVELSSGANCNGQLNYKTRPKENTDFNYVKSNAETYYILTKIPSKPGRIIINYWWTYYVQQKCDGVSGAHDYDWENVIVQVDNALTQDGEVNPDGKIRAITFYQHKGSYTRRADHTGFTDGSKQHPVVYVGKTNHGSYHDDGGTGTCCYWEDWRNPGSKKHYLDTWVISDNMVELDCNSTKYPWMGYNYGWGGIGTNPLWRNRDYSTLDACAGFKTFQVCHTNGCFKSDFQGKLIDI